VRPGRETGILPFSQGPCYSHPYSNPERCKMPVAEIIVVPLGTANPSLSRYVAEVEKVIRASGLVYQLTPMSTCVEGSLEQILDLTRAVHLCLFQVEGVLRVSTTLKIDDRRDKPLTLAGKVLAVEEYI
jgi:uncharacterized protein (TIGR00106 family)